MKRQLVPQLLIWLFAISANAQSQGIPTDSLIAFYSLNDTSVQNAASESLHGVVHGAPTPATDRFGNPSGAMRFESGDYVTVPGSSGEVYLPFSVSLWYSPDPEDTYSGWLKPLFKKYSPAYWRGVQVGTTYRDGQQTVIPWYLRSTTNRVIGEYGSPPFLWTSTSQPSDSSWYHVVFTVDSLGGKLYVNGELIDSQPWDGQYGVATSYHNWQLAGSYEWADTVGYIGALDDVAIWNKTLSSGEVANMYEFDGETYAGCTNPEACNYDAFAVVDNGSCAMPGAWCNDGNENTVGDALTDDCLCVGHAPVDTSGAGACQGQEVLQYLGRDYHLVEIGNQCWFSENLASSVYANGDTIPYGTSGPTWPSFSQPKWGVLGDSLELAAEYGYLYNHVAASDERNLCPAGWRVPSRTDFETAVSLFGSANAAYRSPGILESGTGLWTEVVGSGNNASGFNGQPFGMRTHQGTDVATGIVTSFWANESPLVQSGNRWILGYHPGYPFQSFSHLKSRGSYVRCVQGPLPGCTNDGACNYNPDAEEDNGSCVFAEEQGWCDCDQNVLDDCGVCGGDNTLCPGCTDPEACNYNPQATVDDGSCQTLAVETTSFCILDEGALVTLLSPVSDASAVESGSNSLGGWSAFWSNGAIGDSVEYAYGEFQGSLVLVLEEDTLCAASFEFEIAEGCNDPEACNFNGADLCNVGCIYPVVGEDCSGGEGLCGEGTYWNASSQSCLVAVPGDFDYDGCINVNDLLGQLAVYNLCFDVSDIAFDCGLDNVSYHGYDYSTVQIGDQCWFAENLRTTKYANGDSISIVLPTNEWVSNQGPAMTFREDSAQTELWGAYYNWESAVHEPSICPAGWHVPSHLDWSELEIALGMEPEIANALGQRGGNLVPNALSLYGDNTSGFSAYVAGFRYEHGGWDPNYSAFWTADETTSTVPVPDRAISRKMFYTQSLPAVLDLKAWALSVRCLKD